VIVNDAFETAIDTLECIIVAETHRAERMGDVDSTAAAMAAELNDIVEGVL
jgi:hypothetical protein